MSKVLFKKNDSEPKNAFFIQNGKFYININEEDHLCIERNNFLIGSLEIFLSDINKVSCMRKYSLFIDKETSYIKIPKEELLKNLIYKFKSGFIICRSLATELIEINKFITNKQNLLGKEEKINQNYCILFASTIQFFEKIYKKNRFHWIYDIVSEYKNSLTFIKGLALISMNEIPKIQIDNDIEDHKSNIFFKRGSTVFLEGEESDNLYILLSGKLQILVKENQIDLIEQESSIIGEMALLLNKRRTATIRAIEDSKLKVVKKSNFEEFCRKNKNFLKDIAHSLCTRINSNLDMISELNDSFEKEKNTSESVYERKEVHKQNIENLKNKIKLLSDKYDFDWLTNLYIEISKRLIQLSNN